MLSITYSGPALRRMLSFVTLLPNRHRDRRGRCVHVLRTTGANKPHAGRLDLPHSGPDTLAVRRRWRSPSGDDLAPFPLPGYQTRGEPRHRGRFIETARCCHFDDILGGSPGLLERVAGRLRCGWSRNSAVERPDWGDVCGQTAEHTNFGIRFAAYLVGPKIRWCGRATKLLLARPRNGRTIAAGDPQRTVVFAFLGAPVIPAAAAGRQRTL